MTFFNEIHFISGMIMLQDTTYNFHLKENKMNIDKANSSKYLCNLIRHPHSIQPYIT